MSWNMEHEAWNSQQLLYDARYMKIFRMALELPRLTIAYLILTYQRLFSPDHSFWSKTFFPRGYCKYYPSCSEYARQAIGKRGVLVGSFKAVWRVVRCNPWSGGGVDLP